MKYIANDEINEFSENKMKINGKLKRAKNKK